MRDRLWNRKAPRVLKQPVSGAAAAVGWREGFAQESGSRLSALVIVELNIDDAGCGTKVNANIGSWPPLPPGRNFVFIRRCLVWPASKAWVFAGVGAVGCFPASAAAVWAKPMQDNHSPAAGGIFQSLAQTRGTA
jgi:hypothetical protein